MRTWATGRTIAEVLLLLVPALATAVFLFIDLSGLTDLDWRWLALASFAVFLLVVMIDGARLVSRVRYLEDASVDLGILFDPDDRAMGWPEECWYRFKVRNQSERVQARDVEARLLSIVPDPLTHKALPSNLGVKDGGVRCNINPGADDLFDVVRRRPDTKNTLQLWIIGAQGLEFTLDPGQVYEMNIRVSAANARQVEHRRFLLRHRWDVGEELSFHLVS